MNMWGGFSVWAAATAAGIKPPATPGQHRARYELALADPCGGGYVRDCACGELCPQFRLEAEADAWLTGHIAEATQEAAA